MKEFLEESKNSLEERENVSVDPVIQKRCIHRKGAGSERWAEQCPRQPMMRQSCEGLQAVHVAGPGLETWLGHRPHLQSSGEAPYKLTKGLGLCTNLVEVQTLAPTGPPHLPSPGEKQEKHKEDQPQGLVSGGAVVVPSGPVRRCYRKAWTPTMSGP